MTKEKDVLYLLVTDLGYATVKEVVWEKLDDVTGDTEYTDELFETSKPRDQAEVDYQLALQLSDMENTNGNGGGGGGSVDADALQEEQEVASAIEASILESTQRGEDSVTTEQEQGGVGVPVVGVAQGGGAAVNKVREEEDAAIARKLQDEEYSNESQQRNNKKGGCIIS